MVQFWEDSCLFTASNKTFMMTWCSSGKTHVCSLLATRHSLWHGAVLGRLMSVHCKQLWHGAVLGRLMSVSTEHGMNWQNKVTLPQSACRDQNETPQSRWQYTQTESITTLPANSVKFQQSGVQWSSIKIGNCWWKPWEKTTCSSIKHTELVHYHGLFSTCL